MPAVNVMVWRIFGQGPRIQQSMITHTLVVRLVRDLALATFLTTNICAFTYAFAVVRPVESEEERELRVLCETYAFDYNAKDPSTISSSVCQTRVQSVYEDSIVQRQRWRGQNEPCLSDRLETS